MTAKEMRARREKIRKEERKTKAKAALFGVAFFAGICVTGTIDYNTEMGIHKVDGIVQNSVIVAENEETYKASGFIDGSTVTIKLDGNGNILSIVTR